MNTPLSSKPDFFTGGTLRQRFIGYFIFSALLMVILVFFILNYTIQQIYTRNFEQRSQETLERMNVRIQHLVNREQEMMDAMYQAAGRDTSQLMRAFGALERYDQSFILDPEGMVIDTTDPVILGYQYTHRSVHAIGVNSREPVLHKQFCLVRQQPVIQLIYPVYTPQGRHLFTGVHLLNTRWLEEQLVKEYTDDASETLLIDEFGVVLLDVRQTPENSTSSPKPTSLFDYGLRLEDLKNAAQSPVFQQRTDHLLAFQQAENNWGFLLNKTSTKALHQELADLNKLMMFVAAVLMLIFTGLGTLLAKQTMKPIYRLTHEVKETLEGRQDRVALEDKSELALLVNAFNQSWAHNQEAQQVLMAEKQRAEAAWHQAEAASKAKSQFLANISHELRTPLTGVIGMTDLAMSEAGNNPLAQYFKSIHQSAMQLLNIINDLVDYTRIGSGQLVLDESLMLLHPLLEAVVAKVSAPCLEKNLELDLHIEPQVPFQILGDEKRLGQALGELLDNAVKFTQQGHIHLQAQTLPSPDGNTDQLCLTVSDTGIGIAKDTLPLIFEPFQQAEGGLNRRYKGTGLGLSLCRELVTLMGGSLEVESTVGKGSNFTIILPLLSLAESDFSPDYTPVLPAESSNNGPALSTDSVDFVAGLYRAGGNRSAYHQVLRLFVAELKDLRQQESLSDGALHRLKGAAGNVGAQRLMLLARQKITPASVNAGEWNLHVRNVYQEIDRTIQQVEHWLDQQEKTANHATAFVATAPEQLSPEEQAALQSSLTVVQTALQQHQLVQDQWLENIRHHARDHDPSQAQAEALFRFIEQFEYDQALELLNRWQEEFKQ